jgi:hypothetical protein
MRVPSPYTASPTPAAESGLHPQIPYLEGYIWDPQESLGWDRKKAVRLI